MARPPASDVALFRAAIDDTTTLAQADLLSLWRRLRVSDGPFDPDELRDALLDEMPAVLILNHRRATSVAADYYDVMRSGLEVRGRFQAVPEPELSPARAESMLRWGIDPMYRAEQAPAAALSLLAGASQRLVADGARQTIVRSAHADPAPVGWVRVGSGECSWCADKIDGVVHYVEGYDFQAHDNCKCSTVIST